MPPSTRPLTRSARLARVALSALVLAAIAIAVAIAAPGRSAGEAPPATGAAAIVPGDALAYVHLATDSRRPAFRRAIALLARLPDFPLLSATVQTRLGVLAGGSSSIDFDRDIRPWLGREAAFALLNTPTSTAGSLIVLDVRDRPLARAFLSRVGAAPAGSYNGTDLLRYAAGASAAFVSHYFVFGQDSSVRAAIDVATGRAGSLASDRTYRRAAVSEPAGRVLDAYASQAGVQRLLAPQGGIVGALAALLYQPALSGFAISVTAESGGAQVRVHRALDSSLTGLSGSHPVLFTPTLQRAIPAGSALMLDVSGLDTVAPHLLSAGAAAGVGGRIGPLLARLGAALTSEGVNVHEIVSLFHGESAVAISPAAGGTGGPSLVVVARTRDPARTKSELASLETPLAQLFPPAATGPGQAPEFSDRQIAGVEIRQLALNPGLQLDYGVFDGLVVISTSLDGIAEIARHAPSLAQDPAYRATLPGRSKRVTSLLFLDFSQLLSLGEQTGLTASARYRALRADLEKIRAVGLDSTSGETDSTAELFLQIP